MTEIPLHNKKTETFVLEMTTNNVPENKGVRKTVVYRDCVKKEKVKVNVSFLEPKDLCFCNGLIVFEEKRRESTLRAIGVKAKTESRRLKSNFGSSRSNLGDKAKKMRQRTNKV